MRVFVLGAGPTGLALIDGLVDSSNIEFTIIERSATIGGLAQTLNWENHGKHDLGPHKIFTLDQDLLARVKGLIPQPDWLVRPKKSKIFMKGKFLPYPPSPFSLLGVYGLYKFFWMVFDYSLARLRSAFVKVTPRTFEEDLSVRVGGSLYNLLFKPIALKLWGDPQRLDVKLSKGRVQTPSMGEVLAGLLKLKRQSSSFEALEFIYPRGGLQRLWEAIHYKCQSKGKFLLNTEILELRSNGKFITDICCRDVVSGQTVNLPVAEDDIVFSTLPIGILPGLMRGIISPSSTKLINEVIQLNDLLLVFLHLDCAELIDQSWVFVPDPAVAFHRISEQKSFDPSMTLNGSIVCCEIMSNDIRPMSGKSNQELTAMALEGIANMGFKEFKVLASRVIRLPKSYPVFRPNFENGLKSVLAELDTISNFRTIGRQGAFNYIGTLDCMDIGYGAADWCMRKIARSESDWSVERKRTSFYPVLD